MSRHRRPMINWRRRYLSEVAAGERVLAKIADKVFTLWTFLAHLVIYPIAMLLEGGDYHLFLDAISIEAVFVGLAVGVNTKLQLKAERVAQEHRDHVQECIERSVESDTALTEAVHGLTEQIHQRVVRREEGAAGLSRPTGRVSTPELIYPCRSPTPKEGAGDVPDHPPTHDDR